MLNDFAIFICTHERPNKQITLEHLRKGGYTGKIYLVLDDTDATIQEYIDRYGVENIIIFDKNYYIKQSDTGIRNKSYKAIVYAKNAVENVAKSLKLNSFVVADDDLSSFRLRKIIGGKLLSFPIVDLDTIIGYYNEYMLQSNLVSIAFCGSVQYMSGLSVFDKVENFRIPYNFVFRNCAYGVDWFGTYAEDITTALIYNRVGATMLSVPFVQFSTVDCCASEVGGMSNFYKTVDSTTRELQLFEFAPSAFRLRLSEDKKLSRCIIKEQSYPKIISDKYRR